MADYCSGKSQAEEKRTVRLKFLRSELLYDIKNNAYIEADVMGEDMQHAQHVLTDIGEEGNVDRVNRILAVVYDAVIEMLYPYTKRATVDEEIDDRLFAPEEFVVELHVPASMSRTTMHLLSKLIHEYMVYRVVSDWLSITNPNAADNWSAKAEAAGREIERAKNQRGVGLRRASYPW